MAYKSDSGPDSQWRPVSSKVVNEVYFDDGSLVKVNLHSKTFTESVENQLNEKSTTV